MTQESVGEAAGGRGCLCVRGELQGGIAPGVAGAASVCVCVLGV